MLQVSVDLLMGNVMVKAMVSIHAPFVPLITEVKLLSRLASGWPRRNITLEAGVRKTKLASRATVSHFPLRLLHPLPLMPPLKQLPQLHPLKRLLPLPLLQPPPLLRPLPLLPSHQLFHPLKPLENSSANLMYTVVAETEEMEYARIQIFAALDTDIAKQTPNTVALIGNKVQVVTIIAMLVESIVESVFSPMNVVLSTDIVALDPSIRFVSQNHPQSQLQLRSLRLLLPPGRQFSSNVIQAGNGNEVYRLDKPGRKEKKQCQGVSSDGDRGKPKGV
mmetsp:Transcript_17106/g.31631  ORF Transcript_17106/g.31631 Transcript_17106/m.31631 type:complete len:277 (-) Transcript_17106:100-930(-)